MVRITVLLFCSLMSTASFADGFSVDLTLPDPLNIQSETVEAFSNLPILLDDSSRSEILKYRQNLKKFGAIFVEGLHRRIEDICDRLSLVERNARKVLSRNEMSQYLFNNIIEQIESERKNCDPINAKTSPYFDLYHELRDLHTELETDSLVTLSKCDSSQRCRKS